MLSTGAIHNLAVMTKNGFDEVHKDMDDKFKKVDQRFDKVEGRLDKIENIIVANYDRRFERVEDNIRLLKTALRMR